MSSVNVNIEVAIINWVENKLIADINTNTNTLNMVKQWKTGEKKPTFKQVQDLSKKTNIPLGYFFLKTPPQEECKIIEYRTIDSLGVEGGSRNLLDVVDNMTDVQEWMKNYLINNGYDALSFVGKYRDTDDLDEVIDNMRNKLKMSINWHEKNKTAEDAYKRLRYTFEEVGIIVMANGVVGQNTHRKLDIKEFRAFTLIDKYAPLIFINTNDSINGKIFSLLHEAAHIWFGVNSFYNDKYGTSSDVSRIEKMCNYIAAELLVPSNIFIKKWNESEIRFELKVEKLAKEFNCSRCVIARKALDFSFISIYQYTNVVDECIKQYEKSLINSSKKSGGDYYNTMVSRLDHRLVTALANSAKEGKTQYREVYQLTNTNRVTFEKIIERVGGTL